MKWVIGADTVLTIALVHSSMMKNDPASMSLTGIEIGASLFGEMRLSVGLTNCYISGKGLFSSAFNSH